MCTLIAFGNKVITQSTNLLFLATITVRNNLTSPIGYIIVLMKKLKHSLETKFVLLLCLNVLNIFRNLKYRIKTGLTMSTNLILEALHKSVFRDVLNEYYDNNWHTKQTQQSRFFCTKAYAVSWPNCQSPPSRVLRHLLFKANTTCKKNDRFLSLNKSPKNSWHLFVFSPKLTSQSWVISFTTSFSHASHITLSGGNFTNQPYIKHLGAY